MKTTIALLMAVVSAPSARAFIAPSPRQMATATATATTAQRQPVLFQQRPDPLSILPERKPSTDPTPVLVSAWKDAKLPIAAAIVAAALWAAAPLPSEAAMSGGRMGGSFSSSPTTRMVSPSRSSSSSSFRSGYSSGYRSGYYSRPSSVIVAPTVSPFYSPFGYGGYGGYGYSSPGVISYSSGGSGLFSFLLFGGLAFAAVNALGRGAQAVADSPFAAASSSSSSALGPGRSVVQLSVAVDVSDRDDPNSILGALDRLSQTARTDSRVGIQDLTSQVAVELLRRRSSIASAWTSARHFKDAAKAQREFQSRAVRERSKFETETVSNYGGVDYGDSRRQRSNGGGGGDRPKATMAVITLVLAIDGDQTKLPTINGISDVEAALRKIASDVKVDDCLQSAEILWTPEDRSETLSMRDVVADYPELRAV